MQLLRSARTHAIARGGAVLVAVTMNGGTDRGTFNVYEAVGNNPGAGTGIGLARAPISSCKTPMKWTPLAGNQQVVQFDWLNLNTPIEQQFDIQTELVPYTTGGVQAAVTAAYICFTPLGRTYYSTDTNPVFDGSQPMLAPLEFRVQRMNFGSTPVGTVRSVLLPPNGMARVFSHTWAGP
jgi:hypothetical protein